jgi:ketosteroid isomerase-like protein
MKIKVLLFATVVSISAIECGRNREKNNNDSTIIIQLENDWAKALVNRDEAVFNKLLAADFFYTENDKMYSRAEVIQSVISIAEKVESAYNEDMQVRIKDNTAIVTGWLFVNGKGSGGNFKRKYRFTDVWYNNTGSWQLIAAQDYLVPQ